jgi:cardiolipin synthase
MIADIEAARANVHVCFYIWLPDESGSCWRWRWRAARRGVRVRVLADALGSRQLCARRCGKMRASGVDAREALPVGNLAWTLIRGRVDLRNHRKALIVDNAVAWCGSQNAADPEFRIKPRLPLGRHHDPLAWPDRPPMAVPVRRRLDGRGWRRPDRPAHRAPAEPQGDIVAQGIGTGPTVAYGAMNRALPR